MIRTLFLSALILPLLILSGCSRYSVKECVDAGAVWVQTTDNGNLMCVFDPVHLTNTGTYINPADTITPPAQ